MSGAAESRWGRERGREGCRRGRDRLWTAGHNPGDWPGREDLRHLNQRFKITNLVSAVSDRVQRVPPVLLV